jgi:dTDP-4-amino-4,6-dideoxygalactose transaminase
MVDVCKDFNISIRNIEKAITKKTKVIIPVDIAGLPCDYDEINALVHHHILKLFEPKTDEQKKLGRILILSDSAHSFGAIYKGNIPQPHRYYSIFFPCSKKSDYR